MLHLFVYSRYRHPISTYNWLDIWSLWKKITLTTDWLLWAQMKLLSWSVFLSSHHSLPDSLPPHSLSLSHLHHHLRSVIHLFNQVFNGTLLHLVLVNTGGSRDMVSALIEKGKSVSHSVLPDSLQSHGLQPSRLPCPWDFPDRDTGVICHFLLQRIFLPGDRTWVSCTAGRFFTDWSTRVAI